MTLNENILCRVEKFLNLKSHNVFASGNKKQAHSLLSNEHPTLNEMAVIYGGQDNRDKMAF